MSNGQLGVLRGYLANADQVRAQGVEVDFSVRPSERFTAYVSGAYTDAKYVKFVDAPCPPELAGGTAATGDRVPGAGRRSRLAEPGELRRLGPGPAGRVEMGVLLGRGSQRSRSRCSARTARPISALTATIARKFSSNPSASIYSWIDGYALTNFRLGFRADNGLEHLRAGCATPSTWTISSSSTSARATPA